MRAAAYGAGPTSRASVHSQASAWKARRPTGCLSGRACVCGGSWTPSMRVKCQRMDATLAAYAQLPPAAADRWHSKLKCSVKERAGDVPGSSELDDSCMHARRASMGVRAAGMRPTRRMLLSWNSASSRPNDSCLRLVTGLLQSIHVSNRCWMLNSFTCGRATSRRRHTHTQHARA